MSRIKSDAPVTPSTKAHKERGSIPARLTLIPTMEGSRDYTTLNPFLKRFKQATVTGPGNSLPAREPRMVTRGPVGGDNAKGQSQH